MKKKIVDFRIRFFQRIAYYLWEAERHTILKSLKSCGSNFHLQLPFFVSGADHVEIGNDVSIGAFVHFWGEGGIKIGNRVMIGSHTAITSLGHDYHATDMYSSRTEDRIIIEDNVWIGTHCVILPGIRIGKGAVIGAGAVVTQNVEPYAIVFGAPAKFYKFRDIKS